MHKLCIANTDSEQLTPGFVKARLTIEHGTVGERPAVSEHYGYGLLQGLGYNDPYGKLDPVNLYEDLSMSTSSLVSVDPDTLYIDVNCTFPFIWNGHLYKNGDTFQSPSNPWEPLEGTTIDIQIVDLNYKYKGQIKLTNDFQNQWFDAGACSIYDKDGHLLYSWKNNNVQTVELTYGCTMYTGWGSSIKGQGFQATGIDTATVKIRYLENDFYVEFSTGNHSGGTIG